MAFGLRASPSEVRTLGVELAGEVEAVGAAVREFKVGDEVFGHPSRYFGAHAEYVCVSERAAMAPKPGRHELRRGRGRLRRGFPGARHAAEGWCRARGAGSSSTARPGRSARRPCSSAKHFGAHVTAVCGTDHVELVRSLGADEVVDYRQQDFTKSGQTYDAIIDAVGKYSFRRGRRALRPGGIYVATDGGRFLVETLAFSWRPGSSAASVSGPRSVDGSRQDVLFFKELIEAGEFRAVVDRRYPMDQAVEAHRYVETWHKAGNVVLTIAPDSYPTEPD